MAGDRDDPRVPDAASIEYRVTFANEADPADHQRRENYPTEEAAEQAVLELRRDGFRDVLMWRVEVTPCQI